MEIDVSDLNIVVRCERSNINDSFDYKIVSIYEYEIDGESFYFEMMRCSSRGGSLYKTPYMNDMQVPVWYMRDLLEKGIPFDATDRYFRGLRLGKLSISHSTPDDEAKLQSIISNFERTI